MDKQRKLTSGEWPKLFILVASILSTLTILLPLLSGDEGVISLYFANIIGQIANMHFFAESANFGAFSVTFFLSVLK